MAGAGGAKSRSATSALKARQVEKNQSRCVTHGGGKRCGEPGCSKSAIGWAGRVTSWSLALGNGGEGSSKLRAFAGHDDGWPIGGGWWEVKLPVFHSLAEQGMAAVGGDGSGLAAWGFQSAA
jgi:hypothetical protein